MHLRKQALLRPAEAEVVSSPTADPVAPVEKEVRKSMERAAFLLGPVRWPSVLVRYSELCVSKQNAEEEQKRKSLK
jgi:hypothetical protein